MSRARRMVVTGGVTVAALLGLAGSSGDEVAVASGAYQSVGIWYSTWYSNGNYMWADGFGSASDTPLLGDVDGAISHRADAVLFSPNGTWRVALSSGTGFAASASPWIQNFGTSADRPFLADVTGDGRADAVLFDPQNGYWTVAPAQASGFGPPRLWSVLPSGATYGHGRGSRNQFLVDVDGDPEHRADAVVFLPNGDWWVALSDGSKFEEPHSWIDARCQQSPAQYCHGAGSAAQFVADVNGDEMGDAVVFLPNGDWHVARSTRSRFDSVTPWTGPPYTTSWTVSCGQTNQGCHGYGTTSQLMGDVDGPDHDGKRRADAIVYQRGRENDSGPCKGCWYVARSNGESLQVPSGIPPTWKAEHGNLFYLNQSGTRPGYASYDGFAPWTGTYTFHRDGVLLADVTGDGKDDPVVFFGELGRWKVLRDPYNKASLLNRWQAYDIQYLPITGGVPKQYSSSDPDVIDEHIRLINSANIDFLLFDLTNGVETDSQYPDGILGAAQAVCKQLGGQADSGIRLEYAVAIHGGSIEAIEREAGLVKKYFSEDLTTPECTNMYFRHGSARKPLLVLFENYETIRAWEDAPPSAKSNTPSFHVEYSAGTLPNLSRDQLGLNASARGNGCGDVPAHTNPPRDTWGRYLGWATPFGSLEGTGAERAMTLMPGHNPHNGQNDYPSNVNTNLKDEEYVSRFQTPAGQPKQDFYTLCGWARIRNASVKPPLIVINSFNEYMEETAVAPTDTSRVDRANHHGHPTEAWSSPTYYWDITRRELAGAPTAARVAWFRVTRHGERVVLRWRTGAENGVLGFNVYRATERMRLNRALIRAGGGLTGRTYTWTAHHGRGGATYELEAVSLDGHRRLLGTARVHR